ncbi:hypothetical protein ACFVFH_13895 [Streptomyces sp. NPDC057697]|uniref:hypothetical protein n=1 Tax=Streptomyces sp. NPDC057697 TaxID=3346219 RepID=UPI00368BA825
MIPAAFDHARTDPVRTDPVRTDHARTGHAWTAPAHRHPHSARTVVAAVPDRGRTRPGGSPRAFLDRREPCRRVRGAVGAVLSDGRERTYPADRTHRLNRARPCPRGARPGPPPQATAALPHAAACAGGRGPASPEQPAAVARGAASDA